MGGRREEIQGIRKEGGREWIPTREDKYQDGGTGTTGTNAEEEGEGDGREERMDGMEEG